MRKKILEQLKVKGDLPAFPDILINIQKKLKDPRSGIADVAKLIESEPTLAGNILKLANSAYYSSGMVEIRQLKDAINRLGLNKIKQLVFSLELSNLFKENPLIDYFKFWKHSLAVAVFTQSLSDRVAAAQENRDIAYLAGLMHDIGIMVFSYLIPDEYLAFLKTLANVEEPLEVMEFKTFNIDHQELGALFMRKWWKIDPHIIKAVRFHHEPFEGSKDDKTCEQILNVANGICNTHGIYNGIECYHEVFKEGAWKQLGLSLSMTEQLIQEVFDATQQVKEMLGYHIKKK